MRKRAIYISEVEAATDFAILMARVRPGTEFIIENDKRPVAVLRAAEPEPVRRTISECVALAKTHEEESGKAPVLDPDFAEDVEEILNRGTCQHGNNVRPFHNAILSDSQSRTSLRFRRRQGAGPLTRLSMVALDCGFAAGIPPTMRGFRLSALGQRRTSHK